MPTPTNTAAWLVAEKANPLEVKPADYTPPGDNEVVVKNRAFGLNAARLRLARPDALVMHPGPVNRGVEVDPAVADGPQRAPFH